MIRSAGIDIGSRSIELVILEGASVVEQIVTAAGHDPEATARALLIDAGCERYVATGYGRQLLEVALDAPAVTEIRAYAVGARRLFPDCRTILDIGGQDMKVIALGEDGKVRRFEMNDRCAAGSGKFLEMMAQSLGYSLHEFGSAALESQCELRINSMCAVFAESEATSLLNRGAKRQDIAHAVHCAVAARALGMVRRVSVVSPVVFAGGGAMNPCLQELLSHELELELLIPEEPRTVGALGAAVIASQPG